MSDIGLIIGSFFVTLIVVLLMGCIYFKLRDIRSRFKTLEYDNEYRLHHLWDKRLDMATDLRHAETRLASLEAGEGIFFDGLTDRVSDLESKVKVMDATQDDLCEVADHEHHESFPAIISRLEALESRADTKSEIIISRLKALEMAKTKTRKK